MDTDHFLGRQHYKNFHSLLINKTEWSLEYGYDKAADQDTYPKRALHAGALFDFELKIRTLDEELDFTCGSSIQGYKIQIHHPAMIPRVKQQHFRIPLDQAVIAAMMPTIMSTSEAIKSYQPERRQCFFPSERSLKYFKIYTQQNCQIECKTNFTMKMCGCVDFYMPREKNTKICGATKKNCMLQAEDYLLSEGIVNSIRHYKGLPLENDEYHQTVEKCNCMPECNAMTYIIENSQSEWDWVRKYQFDRNSVTLNKSTTHVSYLQVFFKGNQFITSERNELYGPIDFLANFGGLLGLFTGFTMLLWWFIALTLALYYCIILIRATYSKWENSPVIVSFATTETPIWKTPFPAVTICPETKSVPKIFNYAEFLHKKQRGEVVPRDDELRLSYVSLLCSYRPGLNLSVNRFGDDDIFDTFQKVGPKFLEKISECAFMGIPHNCSELFTPIITDAGLCYSFNILHRNDILSDIVKHYNDFHSKSINASEWSLQYGYGKKSGKNTYPRRALYAGVSFSFDLKIETTSEDLDSECLKTLQGYKVCCDTGCY
ncbi:hypothetical protein GEV33_000918 [Tenebrio molitor]|uniref:Sodium channel protein Nach n=1 Tax=Tenebrio molitor TaxID=7067 RepID=A0A8J6LK28_TENMO|nr:hypothetical protein GEV33_000918 [Tenebrio molitor]